MHCKPTTEYVFEGSDDVPPLLYKAKMEAWKSGVVIREVYEHYQNRHTRNQESIDRAVKEVEKKPEIQKFVDELFEQMDGCSDFTLIERNHQDECWKEAYNVSPKTELHPAKIFEEYQNRYL
ncbi:hypothetical protein PP175_27915 (plasmid) [Aneurinibacillus sp. Ricciae_BoGa-3]|uniref:hypothetical protein n=1 Tax=Aneurinibacillus sp. Ricciae_BoGa-3 TaxID=3022697 RepID=UPI0023417595|nr:hypothetical protein [Aneurinibacillus sp. Ricciae_BoGa-3]WCK57019.1 hypothetical protein PP175_27915 [Aneurinibacillus sp. Ricciae_BoGa-3]